MCSIMYYAGKDITKERITTCTQKQLHRRSKLQHKKKKDWNLVSGGMAGIEYRFLKKCHRVVFPT